MGPRKTIEGRPVDDQGHVPCYRILLDSIYRPSFVGQSDCFRPPQAQPSRRYMELCKNSKKYSSNCPALPTLVSSRRKQRRKTCKRWLLCKSRANKTAFLELQQAMLVASAAAVVSVPTVLCRLGRLSRHRNVHLLDSDLIYHTVASVNCRRHDVS